jgi:hypothetical protein
MASHWSHYILPVSLLPFRLSFYYIYTLQPVRFFLDLLSPNPTLKKPTMLSTGTVVTALILFGNVGAAPATPSANGNLYPNIVDTSHATWLAADFFQGYFIAKSIHSIDRWMEFFHPKELVYYDATLGEGFPSRAVVQKEFTTFSKAWPTKDTSYPLQILGDTMSAVVRYLDTPGMFGPAEIRSISAVDCRDGKVTRQIDYWDGRGNPDIEGRPGNSQYPTALGLDTVEETAAPEMNWVAHQLNAALSACDAEAAMALFSYDAVFQDITLRTRQEGQAAITRYLQRALDHLPYGPGTTLRHVLGSAQGGGYEWQTAGQPDRNGITALELDGNGLITQLTTVWDGSRTSDKAIQALVALSIEI